jgi:hypothetical protein
MTEVLRQNLQLKAIHILAHDGSPGGLSLGNGQLSLDHLDYYAPKLQTWRDKKNLDFVFLIKPIFNSTRRQTHAQSNATTKQQLAG